MIFEILIKTALGQLDRAPNQAKILLKMQDCWGALCFAISRLSAGTDLRAAKNPRARASCRFAACIWRLRHFAPALCRFSKTLCRCAAASVRSAYHRAARLRRMACSTHLRLAKRHRGLCETTQGLRKTTPAPNSGCKSTRSSVRPSALAP